MHIWILVLGVCYFRHYSLCSSQLQLDGDEESNGCVNALIDYLASFFQKNVAMIESQMAPPKPLSSSFRDAAGYVFESNGNIYRAVHPTGQKDIRLLFDSGLYDALISRDLIVAHEFLTIEQSRALGVADNWIALKVVNRIPIISYACEWTDIQLNAAALLTLNIQRLALKHGLSLKDASTYNIQFMGAKPIFIDILSFTSSSYDRAWIAYQQFCEHFLAPLALYKFHPNAKPFFGTMISGLNLNVTSRLLPIKSWFFVGVFLHIHLHALLSRSLAGKLKKKGYHQNKNSISNNEFSIQLIWSLKKTIKKLRSTGKETKSLWSNYRKNNTYTNDSTECKKLFLEKCIKKIAPRRVLDLGANDGFYSFEVAKMGIPCTAVEVDDVCCKLIYNTSLLPQNSTLINTLKIELSNPTPAYGWAHEERLSFTERVACDLTLALALIHHLAITHQIPYRLIAEYLSKLSPELIVEFIPISDPMFVKLLDSKFEVTDTFTKSISRESFLFEFEKLFDCVDKCVLEENGRFLYYFKRKC